MIDKRLIRQEIKHRKQQYTSEQQLLLSHLAIQRLLALPEVKNALRILLYHSLPDELYTHACIEQLAASKDILLPVVKGEILELASYQSTDQMKKGAFQIWEPTQALFTDYSSIDLAIIPGIAFDREGVRIGRGKGYYDRLLPLLSCPKIGLCFHYQLWESPLPKEAWDISMDRIVTDQIDFSI